MRSGFGRSTARTPSRWRSADGGRRAQAGAGRRPAGPLVPVVAILSPPGPRGVGLCVRVEGHPDQPGGVVAWRVSDRAVCPRARLARLVVAEAPLALGTAPL